MTIIMSLYRSVSSLILIISIRRNQNRCHHCKGTKCRRYHITHNISVIILACPDKSALCFHDTSNDIIDQTVEVSKTGFLEFLLEFLIKYSLENLFEFGIISLGNRILGTKPYILLCIQCIVEAASCKALDGCLHVVHTHGNSRSLEILYQGTLLFSVL